MRELVVWSIVIACAATGGSADAAFTIKLKNGNEFVTGRYWRQGGQVLFDTYSGVFGIERAFITKIEPLNNPIRLATGAASEIQDEKFQAESISGRSQPIKPLERGNTKSVVKREEDPISQEFDVLKERSSTIGGMLTSELMEFSKNLASLKRKIQTSGKSNDYLNEFSELHKIGDIIEDMLKARN